MKNFLINILKKTPFIQKFISDWHELKKNTPFTPGHFYSSIISIEEIKQNQDKIWVEPLEEYISGIELNIKEQLELVSSFSKFYNEIPFKAGKTKSMRYYFDNGSYSYTDAIFLYSMIRLHQPKNIIEVGSGYSSSIMLDTNEKFMSNKIKLTFIDPNIQRLNSLLKKNDESIATIIHRKVQDVPIIEFTKLEKGDILFIDSSHVAKTGSDLNHIIFNVLPVLKNGVLIHFHDIHYPFEYPKELVFNGINWNEIYFLKAFLMHNSKHKIILFSDYLHKKQDQVFKEMPLTLKNKGSNLWLEKKIDS